MTAVSRPLVVAHRGSSEAAPEHTLAAYHRAIEDGADALEADVRLTADGHLVCVHDRRVDRTFNGRGVLSTLELADLQSLDFRWQDDASVEAPDRVSEDHSPVLTLDRLLELIVDAPRPIQLMVETKHPTRYAGLVERTLVTTLRRYGLVLPDAEPQRVTVMSFSEVALRRVRRLAPPLPLVLLMWRGSLADRSGLFPRGGPIAGAGFGFGEGGPPDGQRGGGAGKQGV